MSDFDFDAAAAPISTEDPAADFLAREQSALGDLDEDFAFSKESQPIQSEVTKDVLFTSDSELSKCYQNVRIL